MKIVSWMALFGAAVWLLVSVDRLPGDSNSSNVSQNFPAGRTLFVDQVFGSDSNGRRGSASQPFSSLWGAKNASSFGDLIIVRPGLYSGTNLLKAGVNWYFSPGCTVSNTVAEGASDWGIFDDRTLGAATTNVIDGFGDFIALDSIGNPSTTMLGSILTVTNPASRITFKARRVLFSDAVDLGGSVMTAIVIGGGTNYLEIEELRDPNYTGNTEADGVLWTSGDCYAAIKRASIPSVNGIVYWGQEQTAGSTNSFYWTGQYLQTTALYALYQSATHLSFKSWISIAEVNCTNSYSAWVSGGKFYLTSQKIGGLIAVYVEKGEAWVNAQKITAAVWLWASITGGGGICHLDALQYEDLAANYSYKGFFLQGGTNFISGTEALCTNHSAVSSVGPGPGQHVVSGLTIKTVNTLPGGNTNFPVFVGTNGNGLTLLNCSLDASGGVDSIGTTNLGQSVKLMGSLQSTNPIGANLTNTIGIFFSTNNGAANGSLYCDLTGGKVWLRTNQTWVVK